MKQLQDWLAGQERDYEAGVALYVAHGRSGVLRRLLASTCTDYTREVLARELQVLCDAHVTGQPEKRAAAPAKAGFLGDGQVIAAPADPDAELRRARRDLFARRDYLHARLELAATDADRLDEALALLATAERLRLSYDVAAGRVAAPAAAPPAPDLAALGDAGEIRRLLANLRPQRSKLKKRPDRADDLARIEADIQLLEAKLK